MTRMRRRPSSLPDVAAVLVTALALAWLSTTVVATGHPQRWKRTNGQAQSTTPAAAVCLYGPAAGMLTVTRASVWARLLDVLAYQGWRADVYVHAYDPWTEVVPRAVACDGNASTPTDVDDVGMASTAPWHLLQPVQEEVVSEEGLTLHPDDSDDRLAASLAAVTRMWQGREAATGQRQYQAIIYARHDLWYLSDLNMASLSNVIEDPDTITTHDACTARRQALPDFMVVSPITAGRLVQVALQAGQPSTRPEGHCSLAELALDFGLKVRQVLMAPPAYLHVDRFGMQMKLQDTNFSVIPGLAPVASRREMCVNGVGEWDIVSE